MSFVVINKNFSILAIIGLGIIVYSNTFFVSFHFDDDAYIVNNFAIRNIQNLQSIWNVCPCRFITFLSIALNYHFHQLHVLGYHLFNLAVHLSTALLVWWLVLLTFATPALKEEKITSRADLIALFAGLIFVSHPLQIEAVTYIWQRAASMAAFFYLASLCFYVKSRLAQDSRVYYILSLVIAVIAMFTKENTITLPLMVVLYEFFFLKKKNDFDWVKLYPFWLIMFIIPQTMVLTKTARVGEIHSIVEGPQGLTPFHYLLTQFRVMMTYLRLLVLPINLNLDYDYPVFKSILEIPVLTSIVCLSAILYAAKILYSKYRILSFCICWFFLTLLPESSILPQTDVIFEHRLYLPIVGYCLLMACGVYYLIGKKTLNGAVIILSLVVAINSVLTFQRNKVWKDEITLWNDIVQKSPHKARPYINRGWAFYNQEDNAKAMTDYNKSIAIYAGYIYPFDDRGLIYAQEGKYLQAIAEYNKANSINPYYAKVYYHRGLAYLKLNNKIQALSDFNKAIKLDPQFVDAYNERGSLYAQEGDSQLAQLDHLKSLQIDPGQPK